MPADAYPLDQPSPYPAAAIAEAWRRERPGTPTDSIGIVTPLWRLAKLFADDRRRLLTELGVDPATLDLLSVLRRAGTPYELNTRQLAERTLVTAGAISQRVGRAEQAGLVERRTEGDGSRAVIVSLTKAGHALVERTVDQVLSRESELVSSLTESERDLLAGKLQSLLDDVSGRVRSDPGKPPRGR
ncbi:MarR family winged helix-turn-helix transcriptional regulator [Kribbella catacumbae]|uniref:MarR family winged helix-turn-helix transcriptional regulator n=1 Tax=Kribbella catacumbae TaxID=460086 RepID=UPI00036C6B99|nr:MarR family transcriptional regulator [Kribbella catacumbae]